MSYKPEVKMFGTKKVGEMIRWLRDGLFWARLRLDPRSGPASNYLAPSERIKWVRLKRPSALENGSARIPAGPRTGGNLGKQSARDTQRYRKEN